MDAQFQMLLFFGNKKPQQKNSILFIENFVFYIHTKAFYSV